MEMSTTIWCPSRWNGFTIESADTARERRRIGRLLDRRHDDGELVAAQPRDRVGLAGAAAQAVRHHLKELVADRMPERVVDALEAVESRQSTASISPRLTRLSSCSSRSRNSTRLGRSVSASWRAMCTIRSSVRWRS